MIIARINSGRYNKYEKSFKIRPLEVIPPDQFTHAKWTNILSRLSLQINRSCKEMDSI
jgi:hypothetical protein